MRTRRPWYLLMLGAVAGPLVLASAAWACANLATLTLDSSSATAGETVNFTGSRFGETGPAPKAGEVVLHWNARDGEVLASTPADASRNISGSITIPNVPAGNYVVVATQLKADGDPVAGTPGRYPIEVVAAGASSGSSFTSAPVSEQAPAPAPQQSSVAAPEQSSAPAAPQAPVAAPQQSSAPAAPQAPVAAPEQSSAPAAPQAPVAAPEQSSAPAPAAPEVAVAPATSGPAAPVALDSSPVASRTALVTPAASSGSSLLPLALVGIGLALSLVASAMVLANRRSYSLARAAR